MTRAIATVCLVLLFAVVASAQYVGYEYKGAVPDEVLPNGVKHLGGALISDHTVDPVYAVAQVLKGRTRMRWLEVSTGQNEKGVTGWRVLDVLKYTEPAAPTRMMLPLDPGIECNRDGEVFTNLIALGRAGRNVDSFTLQRAWLADVEKKKFIPTSVERIQCIYSAPIDL